MCCAFFSWFNHFLKSQNEMCFQWRKRGNVPELKWKSFWTHYFVQSCRNFQLQSLVLIPHFECVNAASSKYQGFPVCCFSWPKQSPRLRWKWLNYKQHFGLSRFYIKKKDKDQQHQSRSIITKQAQNNQHMKNSIQWCRRIFDVISSCSRSFSLCCLCVRFFMFCKNNELKLPFLWVKIPPEL